MGKSRLKGYFLTVIDKQTFVKESHEIFFAPVDQGCLKAIRLNRT